MAFHYFYVWFLVCVYQKGVRTKQKASSVFMPTLRNKRALLGLREQSVQARRAAHAASVDVELDRVAVAISAYDAAARPGAHGDLRLGVFAAQLALQRRVSFHQEIGSVRVCGVFVTYMYHCVFRSFVRHATCFVPKSFMQRKKRQRHRPHRTAGDGPQHHQTMEGGQTPRASSRRSRRLA